MNVRIIHHAECWALGTTMSATEEQDECDPPAEDPSREIPPELILPSPDQVLGCVGATTLV